MMTASIRRLGGEFNTGRMVRDYAERAYMPAHRAAVALAEGQGAGRTRPRHLARAHARGMARGRACAAR